jgi:RNA polymerase sigma-32 factor
MAERDRDRRDEEPSLRPQRALPAAGEDRERGRAGGLVRYDPLRAYMAEVARHPVLTREEEHALAVRYHETGELDAAYKLVA